MELSSLKPALTIINHHELTTINHHDTAIVCGPPNPLVGAHVPRLHHSEGGPGHVVAQHRQIRQLSARGSKENHGG